MLSLYTCRDGRLMPAEVPAESGSVFIWFDLLSPTAEETLLVEQSVGIDIPSKGEMEEIELSARLYHEDGAEFMTVTAVVNLDTDEPAKTPVTFILKGTTLVTVRHAEPKPFSLFAARAQRPDAGCFAGEDVMLGLVEAMIDRIADALEWVSNEVDGISRVVFRGKAGTAAKQTRSLQSIIEQIGRKGDYLSMIGEGLVSLTRLLTYHTAIEARVRQGSRDPRQKIRSLQRDALSLSDHNARLSDKINFLLDATLGLISLEQSQIIKIFSVAAVVFLPPTLVASIYGMNFDFMPELDWRAGYPFALVLMVVSAVLPYLYFKRRGWL
jgi:magnesium transporter